MLNGLESLHVGIKHTDAVGIALFRMAAQQLLSNADAQYGLRQLAYDAVQAPGTQILHRPTRLALSGKYYPFSLLQLFGIVGQQRFHT